MKKFAVNYLLTPYLKYGHKAVFYYIFTLCIISSILSEILLNDYIIIKTIQFLSMIISISTLSILSVMWMKIKWEDMNNDQKLLFGKNNNTLNFNQNCEWVKLYGTKITNDEINSKL